MFLHRIYLDPRSRQARRDLSDPYEMHSTLCRAFADLESKSGSGNFLWRLEPEVGPGECSRVIVQSSFVPDWSRISAKDWFGREPEPSLDLTEKLQLERLRVGQRFRFRLRANPCVSHKGKRYGLLRTDQQIDWIERKGELQCGFSLSECNSGGPDEGSERFPHVRVSQPRMLEGSQRSGNELRVFSALYDGILTVTQVEEFKAALRKGVGHGKALGLGLLSVVPVR